MAFSLYLTAIGLESRSWSTKGKKVTDHFCSSFQGEVGFSIGSVAISLQRIMQLEWVKKSLLVRSGQNIH